MIIECPSCTTRYDIKAQLPAEGRSVRCAKCGNIWRAMPMAADTPAAAPMADEPASEKSGSGDVSLEHKPASGLDHENGTGSGPQGFGDTEVKNWGSFEDHLSREEAQNESENEQEREDEQEPEQEFQPAPPLFENTGFSSGLASSKLSIWPERAGEDDATEEQDENRDGGKVRWFGSFLRRNGSKPGSGSDGYKPSAVAGGETIPFPRPNAGAANLQPGETGKHTLDEARAAVRSVFDSLGDSRPSSSGAAAQAGHVQKSAFDTEASGYTNDGDMTSASGWPRARDPAGLQTPGSRGLDWGRESVEDQGFASEPQYSRPGAAAEEDTADEEAPGQWVKSWRAESEADESDPDAELRNVLRSHFGDGRAGGKARERALEMQLSNAGGNFETVDTPRTQPVWRQPALEPDPEPEEPAAAPDDTIIEVSEDDAGFDTRLYREIEDTREQASRPRRRSGTGGLTLAAAWGLFLCVAAGLIAGFFGFRDITAGALPGLAPLYRALGMPVTLQPLMFEGVQYEWTTSENKPALSIKGAVYNRSARSVKAPSFAITIKDDDPALDREYSANLRVNGSRIKPDDRAEFEIELLAPSPSITAVELELRGIR